MQAGAAVVATPASSVVGATQRRQRGPRTDGQQARAISQAIPSWAPLVELNDRDDVDYRWLLDGRGMGSMLGPKVAPYPRNAKLPAGAGWSGRSTRLETGSPRRAKGRQAGRQAGRLMVAHRKFKQSSAWPGLAAAPACQAVPRWLGRSTAAGGRAGVRVAGRAHLPQGATAQARPTQPKPSPPYTHVSARL
ncbi:uncharacterized protein PSFLO_01359 [Pseudozyma flocculosa]|uniref:Uncharacterized protein n=1 Tax=Pseudozyma flocculosa TaxID=84751 RepID=A0A5C3EUA2_9BASI|nr:uncharacterized protein PSFLO_01359 [Pseudozyma flocculosa]